MAETEPQYLAHICGLADPYSNDSDFFTALKRALSLGGIAISNPEATTVGLTHTLSRTPIDSPDWRKYLSTVAQSVSEARFGVASLINTSRTSISMATEDAMNLMAAGKKVIVVSSKEIGSPPIAPRLEVEDPNLIHCRWREQTAVPRLRDVIAQALQVIQNGGLSFDMLTDEVSFRGKLLQLKRNENKILQCLLKQSDQIVPVDILLQTASTEELCVDTLSNQITQIRRKIGSDAYILNYRGLGYQLTSPSEREMLSFDGSSAPTNDQMNEPIKGTKKYGDITVDFNTEKAYLNKELMELNQQEWDILLLFLHNYPGLVTPNYLRWHLSRPDYSKKQISDLIYRFSKKLKGSLGVAASQQAGFKLVIQK